MRRGRGREGGGRGKLVGGIGRRRGGGSGGEKQGKLASCVVGMEGWGSWGWGEGKVGERGSRFVVVCHFFFEDSIA